MIERKEVTPRAASGHIANNCRETIQPSDLMKPSHIPMYGPDWRHGLRPNHARNWILRCTYLECEVSVGKREWRIMHDPTVVASVSNIMAHLGTLTDAECSNTYRCISFDPKNIINPIRQPIHTGGDCT